MIAAVYTRKSISGKNSSGRRAVENGWSNASDVGVADSVVDSW